MKSLTRQLLIIAIAAALVAPCAFATASKTFTFTESGKGLQDLVLTQSLSKGTAGRMTLSYSLDGGKTFTTFGTKAFTSASVPKLTWDFSAINRLDNAANITFRETFVPASGNNGANASIMKNDIVGATFTPVPEPTTWVAAALGVIAIGWMQRRRLLALVR